MSKKASPGFGTDMARRIWLAGIGAYGSAFSDAQESLSKMSDDTARKFEELGNKGEAIEQGVEARGREVVQRVAAAPNFSLEDRLQKMRTRLGLMDHDPTHTAGVEEHTAQLDRIEEKLDKVISLIEAAAPAKPARKTPARKKAAKKTARKSSSRKS